MLFHLTCSNSNKAPNLVRLLCQFDLKSAHELQINGQKSPERIPIRKEVELNYGTKLRSSEQQKAMCLQTPALPLGPRDHSPGPCTRHPTSFQSTTPVTQLSQCCCQVSGHRHLNCAVALQYSAHQKVHLAFPQVVKRASAVGPSALQHTAGCPARALRQACHLLLVLSPSIELSRHFATTEASCGQLGK